MRGVAAGIVRGTLFFLLLVAPVIAGAHRGTAPDTSAATEAASSPGFAKARGKAHNASKHDSGSRAASSKHSSGRSKAGAKKTTRETQSHERAKTAKVSRAKPASEFNNGVAAALVASPFTRPGSPGRLGAGRGGRTSGGFIGWFGPVFWPYAYDDVFDYVFWPSDSSDYGDVFWAFAYDELLKGIFWADPELQGRGGEIVAASEEVANTEDRSRAGVLGLDGQSREFAQICDERSPWLGQWPIVRISQTIGLAREQRVSLKGLQRAASEAGRILKSACPPEAPSNPVERLEAMQQRVNAMAEAVGVIHPALASFYESLTDAQKARFQSSLPARGEEAPAPAGENQVIPQICTDHLAGLSTGTVDRIAAMLRLTSEQRPAGDALRSAVERAAQVLRAACPADLPADPPERLALIRQRLAAMIRAIDLVQPALEALYDLLSEAQKARFNSVGKQADHIGG